MEKKLFFKHKIENLIEVKKIVTIHYFEFTRDYVFAGESHDFWEFAYADKGEVLCSRKGEEIRLKQGGIIFHKPNEFHTIRSDGVIAPNVFVMSFVSSSPAMSFFNGKQFMLSARQRQWLSAIMAEAEETFALPAFDPYLKKLEILDRPNLGGQQMIRTYLEQLLIMLMRKSQKTGSPEVFLPEGSLPGHLESLIKSYLSENVYGKISLADICKKFNYGKTFICTQFKKSTGQTILRYYMKLKISEAKKLVREKNHTFRQVSEMLQFDNPGHFSATFKRFTGMTPTEYVSSVK